VYVVWIITLLSLFATSIGSQSLFAVNLSERLSEQLKATYIARAAVQYATLVLERDATPGVDGLNEEWSNNPVVFQEHRVAEGTFSAQLMDEERRVNLNTASPEVLQRLLEGAGGLSHDDAAAVVDAILDWRDEDDDKRPLGAEDFDYQTRFGYDCKDAPFENVEELLLVKGVSWVLYRRLEDLVTVFGSGRVNLNTASFPVLKALGLSEAGAQGVLLFRAGDDSQEGTGDDRQLESLGDLTAHLGAFVPADELARLARLTNDQLIGVSSPALAHGTATARSQGSQ
jgi:general secretion pathway protein K